MIEPPGEARKAEALHMIELFASCGADRFDVTLTSMTGEKLRYRPNLTPKDVCYKIPKSLELAEQEQHNVIIRPRVSDQSIFFVQLDDLIQEQLVKVQPASLLQIETSLQNYQGWLAVQAENGMHGKDIASALRRTTGADTTASGATRLAGSSNFKEKYAPNYPVVTITYHNPKRIVTVQELKTMRLLEMPSRITHRPIIRHEWNQQQPKRFPSYDRCLENAPYNSEGNALDTSRADYVWCMTAIDWGWSIEETAAQLLKERVIDGKKHRNSENYAMLTARNAALAVQRNRSQGR